MEIINKNKKLSKLYILIAFLWALSFEAGPTFGAEGRTWMSFTSIIPVLLIVSTIFYFLYRYFNKWLVIFLGAILGIIMEFSFMRPTDLPFGDVQTHKFLAGIFFFIAWSLITGTPFFIFSWSQKSKKNLAVALIIPLIIIMAIVIKLIVQ